MPQYAYYDSTVTPISPVLGWYDTDLFTYASLPSLSDLLLMTSDQWTARLTGLWAVEAGDLVAYTRPLSLGMQAQIALEEALATGINITCTGNAALDSIYALDSTTMGEIGAVASDFASGLGLPGNASTFTYPDINGVPATFTGAQFVELYKAQRDLIFNLTTQSAIMKNGWTPVWPSHNATIA